MARAICYPLSIGLLCAGLVYLGVSCSSTTPIIPPPQPPVALPTLITVTNGHVISEEGSPAVFIVRTNHLPMPAGIAAQDIVVTNRVAGTGGMPMVVGTHTNRLVDSFAADYPAVPSNSLALNLLAVIASSPDMKNWTVVGSAPYPAKGGTLTLNVTNLPGGSKKFYRFGFAVVTP